MHVHQCKSAQHNKRILLDQSPQEATIVVSSTHVQRLSGRGRSSALVSRLNLAWKTIFCERTVFGPTFWLDLSSSGRVEKSGLNWGHSQLTTMLESLWHKHVIQFQHTVRGLDSIFANTFVYMYLFTYTYIRCVVSNLCYRPRTYCQIISSRWCSSSSTHANKQKVDQVHVSWFG